jgi:hypothetical protein
LSAVRQQALTLSAPVEPGHEAALDTWLRENEPELKRRLTKSTTTHFARWALLPPTLDEAGKPIGAQHLLLFETSFDGELDDHVADLRSALGSWLDPAFGGVVGYPGADNLADLVEFFRRASLRAASFHAAHPGLSVSVVHGDRALRRALETRLGELSAGAIVQATDALQLARELQEVARAVAQQNGLALGGVHREPSRAAGRWSSFAVRPFALVVAFLLSPFFEWRDERVRRRQPSFDTPALREQRDRLGHEEDRFDQNALTHLVAIKPGWYRAFALKLMLRVVSELGAAGRLAGMRGLHFTRWVVLPDRRLLLSSYYDGSWQAHLSQLIGEAARVLTMIWTHTIWFPSTHLLLFRGARDEPALKVWVRANQLPTQAWYSAYPTSSVADVGKNAEIRELLGAELDRARAERLLALL